MKYPGRLITKGEKDKNAVRAIQQRLNETGCGPVKIDGDFGNFTLSALKMFQARNVDSKGNPLTSDGKAGAMTWAALFPESTNNAVPKSSSDLLNRAIKIANSQIGVIEKPPHSNRGKEIDEYIKCAGLNPGNYAWCAAFVYWCFNGASIELGKENPLVRTPGVIAHWNKTKGVKLLAADAIQNPATIKPGFIFIMDCGKGQGHTGIVESVKDGYMTTIEGNTNNGESREGYGVFRLKTRKVNSKNLKGFINYE